MSFHNPNHPRCSRKMVPGTWECWTRNKTSWAAKPKDGNRWFSESLRVRFPQLLLPHTPVSSAKTALPAPSWGVQWSVQPPRTWGMSRSGVCHFGLRSLKLACLLRPFPPPSPVCWLEGAQHGDLGSYVLELVKHHGGAHVSSLPPGEKPPRTRNTRLGPQWGRNELYCVEVIIHFGVCNSSSHYPSI